jgi:hypothetical protein
MLPVQKRTVRDDRTWEDGEGGMEFRLTYAGELLASNTGDRDVKPARKEYKRGLRRHFHSQIKLVFETTPILSKGRPDGQGFSSWSIDGGPGSVSLPRYDKEKTADRFRLYGFRFLPLVTVELKLSCWLDILVLRRQPPGEVWTGGDIDNRIKTLFDVLTVPDANQGYEGISPEPDEDPFYCLLENDKLISKVTVETDRMLETIACRQPTENDARVVITVRVKPYEFILANLMFT